MAIAEMESIDRDGDVFDKSAFDKTIAERGPLGSNEIFRKIKKIKFDAFNINK